MYIERRVQKIRKNIPAIGWRHCPTKLNAADIASRGMKTTKKVESEFQNWIMGPHFIRKDSAEWPVDISNYDKMEEKEKVSINCSYETKHKVLCMYVTDDVTNKVTQNIKIFQEKVPIDKIVDIERFSFLQKLLRTTAWVLRYINNLRRKIKKEKLTRGYITVAELKTAEVTWIKAVQRTLENESKQLNNTLGLILDENGVILCKGRLENSELTSSQINPILIPGNHAFARLLVLDAHLKTSHGGKKDTITQLRSKYWVTKGRNLVHRVLHNCPRPCRRLEGKSFKSVESPQLPSFRVRQSFPFCNTGCDYLGPLLVRQVFDGSQMGMYEVWVVLYTCAVTRAVHLDLVPDLSASSFI